MSENQTAEMRDNSLSLEVSARLHATYSERQRAWLSDVRAFVSLVDSRQRNAPR